MIYEGDIKKHLEKIQKIDEAKEKVIRSLREENEKLKDEAYKDTELQRLKSELDKARKDMMRGFPISEEERNTIAAWKKQHDETVHGYKTAEDRLTAGGSIGGRYSYRFVPTSLGTSGTVRCTCGAEFEFQEIG